MHAARQALEESSLSSKRWQQIQDHCLHQTESLQQHLIHLRQVSNDVACYSKQAEVEESLNWMLDHVIESEELVWEIRELAATLQSQLPEYGPQALTAAKPSTGMTAMLLYNFVRAQLQAIELEHQLKEAMASRLHQDMQLDEITSHIALLTTQPFLDPYITSELEHCLLVEKDMSGKHHDK